jgi:hypothetical protein
MQLASQLHQICLMGNLPTADLAARWGVRGSYEHMAVDMVREGADRTATKEPLDWCVYA